MQQYKFRGKRKDNGQWVYGFYVSSPELPFNESKHFIVEFIGIESGEPIFDWHEVIPETAGMWTGLKDKQGVDIYTGDVVQFISSEAADYNAEYDFEKYGSTPIASVLKWNDDACGFRLNFSSRFKVVISMVEVVGNSIDHAYLLTPADKTAKI